MAAPKGNQYALGNKGGGFSTYVPEFCDKIVELGEQGKSVVQMAVGLNVDRRSLDRWAEKHDEFRAAFTRARQLSQDWWENVGQTSLGADKFQAQVWKTSMQARFREDYTERKEHKLDGQIDHADRTPIEMARLLNFAVHKLAHDLEETGMEAEGLQEADDKPEGG